MTYDRVMASLRAIGVIVLVAVSAHAAPLQSESGQTAASNIEVSRSVQSVQSTSGAPAPSPGIVFVDATPDTITTIRTAQNVITRVAFPEEAKEAICGDLFDPASNTGTFVINKIGTDVFIKPVNSKSQTNLFVKTDANVYSFDLVVVPQDKAHRVVNINMPSYKEEIEAMREKARREIAQERNDWQTQADAQLATLRKDLEQKNATALAAEQRKLRTEADRRASDMATRRFVDGLMQGFETVALRDRRLDSGNLEVFLDDVAYVFEGRLYVRYRVTNRGSSDVTYVEPRVVVRGGSKDRGVTTTVITSRGDYVIPGGATAAGVAIFERPALDKGERLYLVVRAEGSDRPVLLRLIEQS